MFLFYTLMCRNYQNWAKETLLESNLDFSEIYLKTIFEDDVKWKKSSRKSCRECSAARSRHKIHPNRSSDAACASPTSRLVQNLIWPRRGHVWWPRGPSGAALWTINSPHGVNPNTIDETPEYISVLRRHETSFRGTEALFWHPAGTGNCPRSHLHRRHRLHHRRCCLL